MTVPFQTPSPGWTLAATQVRSESCEALSGLGVVSGFAIRQPGVETAVAREEALARLSSAHNSLRRELGLGGRVWCTAEQVHGADVAVATARGSHYFPGVDALVTQDSEVCLGIYVADCCAVYFVDPFRRAIGLAHSGAKGTRLGIAASTLKRMRETFGSRPEDVCAVFSPCIRPPLYEVDFAAEIRRQCIDLGVGKIVDPGACTGSHLDRYYSYRMEQGMTGRMVALLALE